MTLLRTLARLLYHSGRSKVDRRHRLKWTTEFTQACAVMSQSRVDEDVLAEKIIELADAYGYSETELAEATYHLAAAGFDREIPDHLLFAVVDFAKLGSCDLSTAADGLTSLILMFDVDPRETFDLRISLLKIERETELSIPETIHIIETVGPRGRHLGMDYSTVCIEILAACDEIEPHPEEDYAAVLRGYLKERFGQELNEQRADN